MKRTVLLKNALILTGFSLLLRLSGIAFSTFAARTIGAEGMGLSQLIRSVFALAVTAATAGVSVAVTRVLTEEMGLGRRGTRWAVMRRALACALLVSMAAATVLFSFAGRIAERMLSDERAAPALRILSLALPAMALAACRKGELLAIRRPIQIAVSDVIETTVEVGLFIFLVGRSPDLPLADACAAIAVGTAVSEYASCLYLFLCCPGARERGTAVNGGGYLRRLLAVSLPVAGSACLAAALRTAENVLVPAGLRRSGLSDAAALADYGMVRGMALPVMFLPFAFLSAFTSLLMPEISEAVAAGRDAYIHGLIRRVVRACLLLSIPAAAVFAVFSGTLAELVYHDHAVGAVILTLAPLVPLMYFDAVADGVLKGLGQQNWVLICNLIDSAIRILLVLRLIPALGFTGFMIVMYVSNIFNPVLSIHRMMKLSRVRLEAGDWIAKPCLAATAAALVVRFLCLRHPAAQLHPGTATAEIVLLGLLYVVLLWFMGCLRDRQAPPTERINEA